MNTSFKFILAAVGAAASMAASAQHFAPAATPEIDARQAQQEARIERGVARGEINRHEARTLMQGQREIARAEARAKADGHVTRIELRQLTAMLDQADVQIRQARHGRDGHRPG
jgi:polyhydroxyalkanoate synthesis regulator phasin